MFSGLPLIADMGADIVFVRVVPFTSFGTAANKGAMNEFLSWEVDLLPRIGRDSTTRFMTPD